MTRKGFESLMRAAGKAVARVRRDPASGLPAKTPVVTMLDPGELGALDAWIAQQPEPKPSRPEAIQLLLAHALAHK
jgi:hypothetical protein